MLSPRDEQFEKCLSLSSSPSTHLQLAQLLRRPLGTEEVTLVHALTPQGMAKINADLCRGVNLEKTMVELGEAFQMLQRRRQGLEASMPVGSQLVLSRIERRVTSAEMIFVAQTRPSMILAQINDMLATGEALGEILEDLACAHQQSCVRHTAQQIDTQQQQQQPFGGKLVSICRLAPVVPASTPAISASSPTVSSLASAAIQITDRGSERIRVGLSPLAVWFDETRIPFDTSSLRSATEGNVQDQQQQEEDLAVSLNPADVKPSPVTVSPGTPHYVEKAHPPRPEFSDTASTLSSFGPTDDSTGSVSDFLEPAEGPRTEWANYPFPHAAPQKRKYKPKSPLCPALGEKQQQRHSHPTAKGYVQRETKGGGQPQAAKFAALKTIDALQPQACPSLCVFSQVRAQ